MTSAGDVLDRLRNFSTLWKRHDDLDPRAPYLDLWHALGGFKATDGVRIAPACSRLPFDERHRQPFTGLDRHPGLCTSLRAAAHSAEALIWDEASGWNSLKSRAELANCTSDILPWLERHVILVSIEAPITFPSPLCPVVRSADRCSHLAVPYPTHYRGSSDELQRHVDYIITRRRSHLAAFFAGRHGLNLKLRDWVHRECTLALPDLCIDLGDTVGTDSLSSIQLGYHDSVYCFQPPGDTATRQGIFDALFSGCIPVFFADCLSAGLVYETMYHPFLPAYQRSSFGPGPWAVVLNATDVLQAPGRMMQQLNSISPGTTRQMRQRIARLLPQLHYARIDQQSADENSSTSLAVGTETSGNMAMRSLLLSTLHERRAECRASAADARRGPRRVAA